MISRTLFCLMLSPSADGASPGWGRWHCAFLCVQQRSMLCLQVSGFLVLDMVIYVWHLLSFLGRLRNLVV